jgi:hypothetical protein
MRMSKEVCKRCKHFHDNEGFNDSFWECVDPPDCEANFQQPQAVWYVSAKGLGNDVYGETGNAPIDTPEWCGYELEHVLEVGNE